MKIKIINIITNNGDTDYKGLDNSKIVAGSQLYDFINNMAYVEYNDSYTTNNDLIEITQAEYDNAKTALNTQQGLTLEERVMSVEQTLNTILLGGI